jgi:hypothetical protein
MATWPLVALLIGCKAAPPSAIVATNPAAAVSSAQPKADSPADPAGQRLDEWLTALNAADRARIERVHAGAKDAERFVSMDMELAERSGGFEVDHFVESTPTGRMALIREKRTGRWRCLTFIVQPDPPHAIETIMLRPAKAPAEMQGEKRLSPLDDRTRGDVIDALARQLEARYVFPEKASAMVSELHARQRQHAYDALTTRIAFRRAITETLRSVSHDRHLILEVGCSSDPPVPPHTDPDAWGPDAGPQAPPEKRQPDARPPFFGERRRLDGNVAYLEIVSFASEAEEVRDEIRQTMSAAADAAAIIFDVRRNGGGMPEPIALVISYLFGSDPVQLSSIYWRPTNRTTTFFTDPKVLGTKFGPRKPVYVLTSTRTFSGAEAFAYDLQASKRAVIVGETTGGGAHPGDMLPLSSGFVAFIPHGRAINPITKTDWEGVGVKPDVEVPADAALDTAHKLALARMAAEGNAAPRGDGGPSPPAPRSNPKK